MSEQSTNVEVRALPAVRKIAKCADKMYGDRLYAGQGTPKDAVVASISRFVSLHTGCGVRVYPMQWDEDGRLA